MTELTQDIVRELLDYDPATGAFTWRWRERRWFKTGGAKTDGAWKAWNATHAGKPAFTALSSLGYRQGQICGRHCKAHRVAWLHVHGALPAELDHRNGVRTDNRIANLRPATRSLNHANIAVQRAGLKGARRKSGRWAAQIMVSGRYIFLGMFDHEHEAHAAYVRAAKAHFGEFARAA